MNSRVLRPLAVVVVLSGLPTALAAQQRAPGRGRALHVLRPGARYGLQRRAVVNLAQTP